MRLRPSHPAPVGPDAALAECEVVIERVGGQGDGIAAGPTFVPLTLAGERVVVRGQGERAELRQVLTPSPERVEPPCLYFGRCGGCALQHWDHAAYLAWKVEQLRSTLARAGIEPDIRPPFAVGSSERRRVALHARRGPGGAMLGFKGRRSWSVVGIETCVIADPRIVRALPDLRRLAAPLLEHPKSAPILHVTATDTGLDVGATGVEAKSGGLSADARRRVAEAAGAADFARVTLGGETLFQARAPVVRFGAAGVVLPPGGFLQASARAEAAMAEAILAALGGAARVADLFCGAGTFSFRIAKQAAVMALDADPAAVEALKGGRAGAEGLKAIEAEARDLFRRPLLAGEMKRLDAVVFDPPRAGAEAQAHEIAASRAPLAVGVSCNPATFARDAAILIGSGFTLQSVLPVDQFLWSPHIELVGVFRR